MGWMGNVIIICFLGKKKTQPNPQQFAFGQQQGFPDVRKPVNVRRERPDLSCSGEESQNSHMPFILMNITHFTALFLYCGNRRNLLLFISNVKSLELAIRVIYTTCRYPIVFKINSLKNFMFFVLGPRHILHSTHKS